MGWYGIKGVRPIYRYEDGIILGYPVGFQSVISHLQVDKIGHSEN